MARRYHALNRGRRTFGWIDGAPLILDLCCGLGGWALPFVDAGWNVIGIDVEGRPKYPGAFIRADVRELPLRRSTFKPDLIVASPPCNNYSRAKEGVAPNPNPEDFAIWAAIVDYAADVGAPLIIENVAGAADFHGKPVAYFGSRLLWGDVPALIPHSRREDRKCNIPGQRKNSSLLRARVPYELGAFLAWAFDPRR
jgi:hypothetical protein